MARTLIIKNKEVIIDDEDYTSVVKFNWYINKMGYAANDSGKSKGSRRTMHRYILGNPVGVIDHANGNKLDNRRLNLRLCNQSLNSANASIKSTNKSGYKGVSWNKKSEKWESYITKNYKHIFLGYFDDIKKAASAYNSRAIIEFGEFAKLNKI